MFKAELYKMYKRKSSRIFLLIYGLILIACTILYFLGESRFGLNIFNSGQFIGGVLSMMMMFLLPFMSLYFISTSFSSELGQGTMKNIMLLPIKKTRIFLTKVAVVQAMMGALLGVQFILSLILSLIQDGGMGLESIGVYFLQYLGAFLVLGLINIIGANISLLVSSTGLTMIIAYVLYLGISIVGAYIPQILAISISRIINNYGTILSMNNLIQLSTIVSYYIILTVTGLVFFDKKEESVCQYD